MKKVSIKSISQFCSAQTKLDGYVSKVSTDSKVIDENTLFIALKDEHFDANDFVEDVL